MEKILYRTEAFSGQMIYDVCDIVCYETFELGNSDILITLLAQGLIKDPELRNLAREFSDDPIASSENKEYSLKDKLDYVRKVIADVSKSSGVDLKYALWLAPKEAIANFYGIDMLDEYDYDAYKAGPVLLSDLEGEGFLFGYSEMPSPLAVDEYPGGVKEPIFLSRKLKERKLELIELRGK